MFFPLAQEFAIPPGLPVWGYLIALFIGLTVPQVYSAYQNRRGSRELAQIKAQSAREAEAVAAKREEEAAERQQLRALMDSLNKTNERLLNMLENRDKTIGERDEKYTAELNNLSTAIQDLAKATSERDKSYTSAMTSIQKAMEAIPTTLQNLIEESRTTRRDVVTATQGTRTEISALQTLINTLVSYFADWNRTLDSIVSDQQTERADFKQVMTDFRHEASTIKTELSQSIAQLTQTMNQLKGQSHVDRHNPQTSSPRPEPAAAVRPAAGDSAGR